jgi:hypothetical protein
MSSDNVVPFPTQGEESAEYTVAGVLEFNRVACLLGEMRVKAVRRRQVGLHLVKGEQS